MSLPSNYLDAFQEIAKSGGFSQATKVLNISQSALSQRIKNLEEEIGLTLFVRTPTGVLLTEQGDLPGVISASFNDKVQHQKELEKWRENATQLKKSSNI